MISKYLNKNFLINLILVILIFLSDRISKIYVIYLDKKLNGSEIFSSKFLNISLIWNEGIAFGLFSFDEKIFYNIYKTMLNLTEVILFKKKKKYLVLMILKLQKVFLILLITSECQFRVL